MKHLWMKCCMVCCCLLTAGTAVFLLFQMERSSELPDWGIYLYLCGSDLESMHGAASSDIEELKKLSRIGQRNVSIVVETGGAKNWRNPRISNRQIGRYFYSPTGFVLEEQLPDVSMGEADTFRDFLNYCYQSHPARHSLVVVWDHGGGVLGGVAYDENHNMDSLSVAELSRVFSETRHHADILGFDACMTSNVDTLYAVRPFADYVIASQELEPVEGWNYAAVVHVLLENSKISPKNLGIGICNAYMDECRKNGYEEEATMALIDLERFGEFYDTIRTCGDGLLRMALYDSLVLPSLRRAAYAAEKYGGNSKEEGFTDMIDAMGFLGHTTYIPQVLGQKLMRNLKDCMVYQVRGEKRKRGNGISMYYPCDSSLRSLKLYCDNSALESYQALYDMGIDGSLSEDSLDYVLESTEDLEGDYIGKVTVEHLGIAGYPVNQYEDGRLELDLGGKAAYLTRISEQIGKIDQRNGELISLGSEEVTEADWQEGKFFAEPIKDWWSLDGHDLYADCREHYEDSCVYVSPILHNNEPAFLYLYDPHDPEKEPSLMAVRHNMEEGNGLAGSLFELKPGDKVTTLVYRTQLAEDHLMLTEQIELLNRRKDFLSMTPYETFVVRMDSKLEKNSLQPNAYMRVFGMTDLWGNETVSSAVFYE